MEFGAVYHQDPGQATRRPEQHAVRESRRVGTGWVAFAGTYLMITGLLNLIWGVTALSKEDYFADGGLVWSQLNTWGWIAVVVAVVQFGTGALLFARKFIGSLLAGIVAATGIFVNFLSIGAYPIWSGVAIIGSALVIWAVTVHSEEFSS